MFAVLLLLPAASMADTYHVRASSFRPSGDESVFDGRFLVDGNCSTGWIENGYGNGTGEWLHFFFPATVIVDSVTLRNGLGTGADFSKINRLKDISVSYSGGQRQEFRLQDTQKSQRPQVKGYPTTSLGLTIHSVYANGTSDDAGFSEMDIRYHRPSRDELEAFERAQAKLVAAAAPPPRKITEKEKKVLKQKMGKLEHKKAVLEELKVFFDQFYTNFVTINEEYPRMFTEKNFLRESAMFESFRSMLELRGVLQKYHEAVVSTSGLRFSIRTLTPTEVELWVKGDYTVIYDLRSHPMHENSLFHLKKEYGEWKVENKTEY